MAHFFVSRLQVTHALRCVHMAARLISINAKRPPGPDDALERIFSLYAPYVAAIAIKLLGRDDDIDDVVQDVFIVAMSGLDQLRDPTRVKGWLSAVTVRLAMRRLRRRRVARAIGLGEQWDPTWLMAPEATPEQRATLHQIYALLEDFPARERLAWSLRFLQGERLEDVALLCECSLATAKRRIGAVQAVIEEAMS
jgi:RNA polymerase sigma-70 factor, ECF subfamily